METATDSAPVHKNTVQENMQQQELLAVWVATIEAHNLPEVIRKTENFTSRLNFV